MSKRGWETIDHLLLHCLFVRDMWNMIISLFGVQWVVPRGIVDLLACWQGCFGKHSNNQIRKAIPHCLKWCIWREMNARNFEGREWTILDLKLQIFRTLHEWMAATRLFSFSNLLDLIGHCNFRFQLCCTLSMLCVLVHSCFFTQ